MEGIMSKKAIAFVLIVLGVIIAVGSLDADVIGIGKQGIGWLQLLGTALGVIVALVGVWVGLRKSDQKK
jgi:hypothetical protein